MYCAIQPAEKLASLMTTSCALRRSAMARITSGGPMGSASLHISASSPACISALTPAMRVSQAASGDAVTMPSSTASVARMSPHSATVGWNVRPCSEGSASIVMLAWPARGSVQFMAVFWLALLPHQISKSASFTSWMAAAEPSGLSTPAA